MITPNWTIPSIWNYFQPLNEIAHTLLIDLSLCIFAISRNWILLQSNWWFVDTLYWRCFCCDRKPLGMRLCEAALILYNKGQTRDIVLVPGELRYKLDLREKNMDFIHIHILTWMLNWFFFNNYLTCIRRAKNRKCSSIATFYLKFFKLRKDWENW